MIDKSFSLVRTNPALTTNIKLVVDSNYGLFLESYNANKDLSDNSYKHYRIHKEDFIFLKLADFFKKTPVDTAFYNKFNSDEHVMYDNYENQLDDTYLAGCSNIEDTWHKEEFEAVAPLYVNPNKIPTNFFIMRIDGPGKINLDGSNFETEILNKWKIIKNFDLGVNTELGFFLDRNFKNKQFPSYGFQYDVKEYQFSRWSGTEYEVGGICDKSAFMDETIKHERGYYEIEKLITDGFKHNNVVYNKILNMKFLFDDTPATPDKLKKYSINRYMGFYIDQLQLVTKVSSYVPTLLVPNKKITNNVFYDTAHYDPIVNGWDDKKVYYVYHAGDYHLLRRTKLGTNVYEHKIISDKLFNSNQVVHIQGTTSKPVNFIVTGNYISFDKDYFTDISIGSVITVSGTSSNNNTFTVTAIIPPSTLGITNANQKAVQVSITTTVAAETITSGSFVDFNFLLSTNSFILSYNQDVSNHIINISYDGSKTWIKRSDGLSLTNLLNATDFKNAADLYIIDIDGKQHVLNYDPVTFDYYIQTDYAIESNSQQLKYWINLPDVSLTTVKSLANISYNQKPLMYSIYRAEFTNICDFDNDIVSTDYAAFEYEKTLTPPSSMEPKFYAKDHEPNIEPDPLILDLPAASEYTASDELFEINGSDKTPELSTIWRKNSNFLKWGFRGSISHNDYPYKLNNNPDNSGSFNRAPNPFYENTFRPYCNLDYFYTLGKPLNTGSSEYTNYSLHIDKPSFDIRSYLNIGVNFDYFDYFFSGKENINGIQRNYKKYAIFNPVTNSESSFCLFRGLKFSIMDVKNVIRQNTGLINEITTSTKNNYADYKFSIIFSTKKYKFNNGVVDLVALDPELNNTGIDVFINKKYKNVLVYIYITANTDLINSVTNEERDTMYNLGSGVTFSTPTTGSSILKPAHLTAHHIIRNFNDVNFLYNDINSNIFPLIPENGFNQEITYYEIKEDGTFNYTQNLKSSTYSMNNLPPFILKIDYPDSIAVDKNSSITKAIQGPVMKLNQPKAYDNNQPLARRFKTVKNTFKDNEISLTGLQDWQVEIFRYSGPYEPIFRNIQLFKAYEILNPALPYAKGNFKFDTSLTEFGLIKEQKLSKVNTDRNLLKLKNTTEKSIYPMVQEFGYFWKNIFSFKSTWDDKYLYQTEDNKS